MAQSIDIPIEEHARLLADAMVSSAAAAGLWGISAGELDAIRDSTDDPTDDSE